VRSLNVAAPAAWIGEEPSKLPWWKAVEDEPVSPREGGVYVDYLGRSTAPERPRLRVEEYLDRARGIFDIDVGEPTGRRRDPRLREFREIVAVVGVVTFGQRVREISERLHKNPGSVSRWVTNAAERRLSDPGFAKRMRNLEDALLRESSICDRLAL
jgi:hypothetical protein